MLPMNCGAIHRQFPLTNCLPFARTAVLDINGHSVYNHIYSKTIPEEGTNVRFAQKSNMYNNVRSADDAVCGNDGFCGKRRRAVH